MSAVSSPPATWRAPLSRALIALGRLSIVLMLLAGLMVLACCGSVALLHAAGHLAPAAIGRFLTLALWIFTASLGGVGVFGALDLVVDRR